MASLELKIALRRAMFEFNEMNVNSLHEFYDLAENGTDEEIKSRIEIEEEWNEESREKGEKPMYEDYHLDVY